MSDEPYRFDPADAHQGSLPAVPPQTPRPAAPPAAGAPYYGPPAGTAHHDGTAPGGTALSNGAPYTAEPADPAPAGGPAPWGGTPAVAGQKRMSTVAKSLTAVGIAALIAVGGTVAVTSANADNASASAPGGMQPVGGEGMGAPGAGGTGTGGTGGGTGTDGTGTGGATGTDGTGRTGGFGGGMASRSLIAGALHGEFVVADGTGTVTERLQTGSITAISSTSLTVKSTDDFTATYSIASGTDVSSLATGTTVTVIAKVDGSTLTVVSITAAMQGGATGRGTGGFTPPDGAAVPGGSGVPDGSGTAPGSGSGSGSGSTAGSTGEDSGV